jgi:hypothetical protein
LAKNLGIRTFSVDVDDDGDKTYEATYVVEAEDGEGPLEAVNCEELPQPGDTWADWGGEDESAICTQRTRLKIHKELEGDPPTYYAVTKYFSSKATAQACADQQITNPLLQPQKVSGTFTKEKEEAKFDRFGHPILNPAGELMRGPQTEFDVSRQEIRIKQNVASLELDLMSQMADTVNLYPLWGYPTRTIKFTPGAWEELYYGGCLCYYTRELIFEIRYKRLGGVGSVETGTGTALAADLAGDVETWDKVLLAEGTKVLRGRWDKDPESPHYKSYRVDSSIVRGGKRTASDFIRFKDWNGENARVILDCYGTPAHTHVVYDSDAGTGTAVYTGTGDDPTDEDEPEPSIRGQHVVMTEEGFKNYYINPWDLLAPLGTVDGFDIESERLAAPHADDAGNRPCQILVSKYGDSDFLLLGVPPNLLTCRQG